MFLRVAALLVVVVFAGCQCGPERCETCEVDGGNTFDAGVISCPTDGGVYDAGAPFVGIMKITNASWSCERATEVGSSIEVSFGRVNQRAAAPCADAQIFIDDGDQYRCKATLANAPIAGETLITTPVDIGPVEFTVGQNPVITLERTDAGTYTSWNSPLPLWHRDEPLFIHTHTTLTAYWMLSSRTPMPVLISKPDFTGATPLVVKRGEDLELAWSAGGGVVYFKIWNEDEVLPAASVECSFPIGRRSAVVPADLLSKLRPGKARVSIETGGESKGTSNGWEMNLTVRTAAGAGERCPLGTPEVQLE